MSPASLSSISLPDWRALTCQSISVQNSLSVSAQAPFPPFTLPGSVISLPGCSEQGFIHPAGAQQSQTTAQLQFVLLLWHKSLTLDFPVALSKAASTPPQWLLPGQQCWVQSSALVGRPWGLFSWAGFDTEIQHLRPQTLDFVRFLCSCCTSPGFVHPGWLCAINESCHCTHTPPVPREFPNSWVDQFYRALWGCSGKLFPLWKLTVHLCFCLLSPFPPERKGMQTIPSPFQSLLGCAGCCHQSHPPARIPTLVPLTRFWCHLFSELLFRPLFETFCAICHTWGSPSPPRYTLSSAFQPSCSTGLLHNHFFPFTSSWFGSLWLFQVCNREFKAIILIF